MPLYMFRLFRMKNMIIFLKNAKRCSTIWHKIYNSKQFFSQIKRNFFSHVKKRRSAFMNRSVNIYLYLVKRGFPQSMAVIYYFENGFRKWVDYFSTKNQLDLTFSCVVHLFENVLFSWVKTWPGHKYITIGH